MRIQAFWGMQMIFTQVAMGSLFQDPAICKFNEIDQCYVAEGQQLHLLMPRVEKFTLIKTNNSSTHVVLRYKKYMYNPQAFGLATWQFVNDNKTLILTSAERSDTGNYTGDFFSSSGMFTNRLKFQVNVEAQVSSVKVSYSCYSPGLMKVDCSADGDDLRFSWTSDLNLVNQLEDGRGSLLLDERHGNLTCHVENHVSSAQRSTKLQWCLETNVYQSNTGSMVFVSVWLFEIIILLSLLVGAFYIYTRIYRKNRK